MKNEYCVNSPEMFSAVLLSKQSKRSELQKLAALQVNLSQSFKQ